MFGRTSRAFFNAWRGTARRQGTFWRALRLRAFVAAPCSLLAAACSRAYLPAVLDDWSQPENQPAVVSPSFDFLDKWLSLLEESENVLLKMMALRMLCQFASTPSNARYLVDDTKFVSILEKTSVQAVDGGSLSLQRLILKTVDAVANSYPPFQDYLFVNGNWLRLLDQWSLTKDEKVAVLTSRLMLRLAADGAVSRHLIAQTFKNNPSGGSNSSIIGSQHNLRVDEYLISILQNLITNEKSPPEALISGCAAIASCAQSSQVFCVRVGGSALLARLKGLSEKHRNNIEVQLHLSEFLKYLTEAGASAPSSRLNAVLMTQGWMQLIDTWAHSHNKDIKLNTVRVLRNLVQDDEIAIKIMGEYGVKLFLDVCSGLDIDIQHAVQDTLAVLTSPRESSNRKSKISGLNLQVNTTIPPVVDSADDIVASSELSGFALGSEDERLDDNFNVIR